MSEHIEDLITKKDIQQSDIFKRLDNLFAQQSIIRPITKVKGGGFKVIDTDTLNKLAVPNVSPRGRLGYLASYYTFGLNNEYNRTERFRDYELMTDYAVIPSVLSTYSEEVCAIDGKRQIIQITSTNSDITTLLENLFFDILKVQINMRLWVRNMVKYGDHFLWLDIHPEHGIIGFENVSPYEVEREEGFDYTNPQRVRFRVLSIGGEPLENYRMAHFRNLNDTKWLPYGASILEPARRVWRQICLRGDSEVWTPCGYVQIKDLKKGDEVYTWNKDKQKLEITIVNGLVYNGKEELFEVKTAHFRGYATADHPFLIKDGSYKKVKDLTKKDWLVLPHLTEDRELKYPTFNLGQNGNYPSLNTQPIIDNFKEFVRFFGFMLGDGWIYDVTTSFCLGDRLDKSRRYVDFIDKIGLNYSIKNEGKTKATCVINSKQFVTVMNQIGFKTGCENKEIPQWIYELPIEYMNEFLMGFVDADGCIVKRRKELCWSVSGINKKLITGMRFIAVTLGYDVANITTTKEKYTKFPNKEKLYTSKACYHFVFGTSARTYEIKKENDVKYEKIYRVKSVGCDDVFDVQVQSNNHNFIVNQVVSSNCMIEDSMLVYRVVRAPERRVFKIDVGGMDPEQAVLHVKNVAAQLKSSIYTNPTTGKIDYKFNPESVMEDYFIPVRGPEDGSKIETLQGTEYKGVIEDLDYLLNQMFISFRIPRAWLSDDGTSEGIARGNLAQLDVRFAKTIFSIQQFVEEELKKIAVIHLYVHGFTDEDLVNFDIKMNNPSLINEQQQLDLMDKRMDVFDKAAKNVSLQYAFTEVLEKSIEEANQILKQKLFDVKFESFLAKAKGGFGEGESPDLGTPQQEFGDFESETGGYESPYTAEENPSPEETSIPKPEEAVGTPNEKVPGENAAPTTPAAPPVPKSTTNIANLLKTGKYLTTTKKSKLLNEMNMYKTITPYKSRNIMDLIR